MNLLEDAKDDDGFILQQRVLSEMLPYMQDAKLLDSEDYNESFYKDDSDNLKVNAYVVNETGERLQLFLVNEESINETLTQADLCISEKASYEAQFKRASRFVTKAIKGELEDKLQEADPSTVLAHKLSSAEGLEQFDVVEIFLITLTATVSFRGAAPQPRNIHFPEQPLKIKYSSQGQTRTKEILLLKRVIDINFLTNSIISRGNREALTVNFKKNFGHDIEVIEAANERNFESYLCVLDAKVLYELYKHYSTRLLEKNVRSFLSFRGVNRGIKDTIRTEPEKFIAFNNGLTITATEAKIFQRKKRTYVESLTDFQIVNGGQTTATIYFAKKEGLDISKVKVMAKITVAKENKPEQLEQLISKISKFSNTQSRVSNVDLRARNPQLVQLKSLSNSVLTPSGEKWFFERVKGEFNTQVRIAGANATRLKNQYPPRRRFSKEQLAKYYSAWGNEPYLVKKGGEKIFRHFIEQISPEDGGQDVVTIDRDFYERLIAKIIVFKQLEKIYGQGKNAMGQLRSAVIPYSLAIVYSFTDGLNDGTYFDLAKIWKNEGLSDDLAEYFRSLLILVNELIKKYSASDDYGEYSKKKELWEAIIKSPEVKRFMANEDYRTTLSKYVVRPAA
jgi:hypothetical protein